MNATEAGFQRRVKAVIEERFGRPTAYAYCNRPRSLPPPKVSESTIKQWLRREKPCMPFTSGLVAFAKEMETTLDHLVLGRGRRPRGAPLSRKVLEYYRQIEREERRQQNHQEVRRLLGELVTQAGRHPTAKRYAKALELVGLADDPVPEGPVPRTGAVEELRQDLGAANMEPEAGELLPGPAGAQQQSGGQ